MDYVQIAKCNFFWIDVPTLYTASATKHGNQLDCVKGTRVFFRFKTSTIDSASPHTKLGAVPMQYEGKELKSRNIWYAHNSMDKVYLPVTETDGPKSYDNCRLLFQLINGVFRIKICTEIEAKKCRAKSVAQELCYNMTQGREYGFFKSDKL